MVCAQAPERARKGSMGDRMERADASIGSHENEDQSCATTCHVGDRRMRRALPVVWDAGDGSWQRRRKGCSTRQRGLDGAAYTWDTTQRFWVVRWWRMGWLMFWVVPSSRLFKLSVVKDCRTLELQVEAGCQEPVTLHTEVLSLHKRCWAFKLKLREVLRWVQSGGPPQVTAAASWALHRWGDFIYQSPEKQNPTKQQIHGRGEK